MRYNTFKELHKNYINCSDNYPLDIDRDKMDDDTHKAFVKDCFDTYEGIGFAETYSGPYTEYEDRKGMKFKVDRRCTVEDDIDLICLPMWKITFEDGFQINAEPEEICLAELDANII